MSNTDLTLHGQILKPINPKAELVDLHRIHAASGAFAAVRTDGRVVTWGDPRGGGDSSAVVDRLLP